MDQTVKQTLVAGIVGQKATNAKTLPIVGALNSEDQTLNIFGRSFLQNQDGTFSVGAGVNFLTILTNAKNAPMVSPSSTPLGYLENGKIGEFERMGEFFVSLVDNAGYVGDCVQASTTTGELKACEVGANADVGYVKYPRSTITKKFTDNIFVISIF